MLKLLLIIGILATILVPSIAQAQTGDLSIESVQVWGDFKETDDWLITVYYNNTITPQYPLEPPEKYWNIQLVKGNCTAGNVTAQSPIRFWGYSVASVYLSAAQASSLEWGGNFSVQLYSSTPGNATCYDLLANDWRGVNLEELDSWCVFVADSIAAHVGNTTYTIAVAGKGKVLDAAIGPIFQVGVPGLYEVRRADLFQEYTVDYERPDVAFTDELTAETDMETRLGTYVYGSIEGVANAMGLEVYILGFIGIAVMYFMLAITGVPAGHSAVAGILSIGILFIGLYVGAFLWVWAAIIFMLAIALFGWHIFLRQT